MPSCICVKGIEELKEEKRLADVKDENPTFEVE